MYKQITPKLRPHLLAAMGAAILLLAYQVLLVQRMHDKARTLETSIPLGSSATGTPDENNEHVVALEASMVRESLYSDVNALAFAAGLSLSSYEESRSVEANQAVLRTQDVALQATATYPNLLTFLANLRAAHPNIALVSVTADRKAGESGRGPAGPAASPELPASIRLRAFWIAGGGDAKRSP